MKTRIIQTRFWDDEFVSETDLYTQHLYIYLLSSQYINMSGIFQLSDKKIMFESKLEAPHLLTAKKNLDEAGKVFTHDGWVFVVNAKKNNNYTRSEDNQTAFKREILRVPTTIIRFFTKKLDLFRGHSSVDSTVGSTSTVPRIQNTEYIINNIENRIQNTDSTVDSSVDTDNFLDLITKIDKEKL